MPDTTVMAGLKKASAGLTYTSETNAPLEPFQWDEGPLSKSRLLTLTGSSKEARVEEITLDDFFRAIPAEDQRSFHTLARVLKQHLTDLKVFKIGTGPRKQAIVVGQTADGGWAGLKTMVVET
jgi:hypothetical protein